MSTAAIPTPAAAPTDISSAIDAIPVVGVESTPEAPEVSPDPPALDTPAEPTPEPAAETDETPAEPQAEEEFDPIADAMDPDRVSPDGKEYHFRANKAKALLQARDFQRTIQEKIPNATPEMLAENYERVTGLDLMLADLDSADPSRVGQAAEALLSTAQNPQAVGVFADQVLARVAQSQPQAFAQIERKITNGIISRMYDEAQRTGDDTLLKLAQNLDYKQTGKFRSVEQLQQRDPLADERARFEQERKEFYSLKQKETQARTEQELQSAQQASDAAIDEEINKAIPPQVATAIKAAPGGDIHLRHIIRDLQEKVEEARKANPTWNRQYQLALDRFRANPSAEAKAQVVNMRRQFAAPIIARNKNAVVKAVTGRILGDNAAAHAKQQQIVDRQEPTGAGAPVRRAGVDQQLKAIKERGGSIEEAMNLLFK